MAKYQRIGDILQEKGITKRWLAKKVRRTEQTIGSICNGKTNPPLPLLFAIAKALEVSPCELLNLPEHEKNDTTKKLIEKTIAATHSKEQNLNFIAGLEELLKELKKGMED